MTELDRRVATLAAVFTPARAAALLARLAVPGAADASALAVRLAAAGRRERLEALSAALAPDPEALRARADLAASLERGPVATLVRALAAGSPVADAVSPVLVRLCRERIGR